MSSRQPKAANPAPDPDPLADMTYFKWIALSPAQQDAIRDNSRLTLQLQGLEGWRVEVTRQGGTTSERFIVGRSTGWRPIHLELRTRRSRGGEPAERHYAHVRKIERVR